MRFRATSRRGWLPALALTLALTPAGTAQAAPQWPPADQATIRPGAELITGGSQCTANFVFYDAASVYLGYSAHCATVPPEESGPVHFADPCGDPSLPLGTAVQIEGATKLGRLVYSSHDTMHRVRESDPDTCVANDFALARVDAADAGRVNPTIPFWGGPTGLRQGIPAAGEKVVSYGNSSLRGGMEQLKPREGVVTNEASGGWEYAAYFASPGIFGDSGSAVIDAAGSASGVLNSISAFPPGTNLMVDLSEALAYMRRHTGLTMRLATGTEPFTGPLLGPGAVKPPSPQPDPQPEPTPEPAPASGPAPAPAGQRGQPPMSAPSRPSTRLRVRVVGKPSRRGRVLRLRLRSPQILQNLALELRAGDRVVARGRVTRLRGAIVARLGPVRRIGHGRHRLVIRAADGRTAVLRLRIS